MISRMSKFPMRPYNYLEQEQAQSQVDSQRSEEEGKHVIETGAGPRENASWVGARGCTIGM